MGIMAHSWSSNRFGVWESAGPSKMVVSSATYKEIYDSSLDDMEYAIFRQIHECHGQVACIYSVKTSWRNWNNSKNNAIINILFNNNSVVI